MQSLPSISFFVRLCCHHRCQEEVMPCWWSPRFSFQVVVSLQRLGMKILFSMGNTICNNLVFWYNGCTAVKRNVVFFWKRMDLVKSTRNKLWGSREVVTALQPNSAFLPQPSSTYCALCIKRKHHLWLCSVFPANCETFQPSFRLQIQRKSQGAGSHKFSRTRNTFSEVLNALCFHWH